MGGGGNRPGHSRPGRPTVVIDPIVGIYELKVRDVIDPYSRVQLRLSTVDLFPLRTDRICACGCEQEVVPPRRRWASSKCGLAAFEYASVVKGHSTMIRIMVNRRDHGVCVECELKSFDGGWQADHIVAVLDGGGGCDLSNFQTLCTDCHQTKTALSRARVIA